MRHETHPLTAPHADPIRDAVAAHVGADLTTTTGLRITWSPGDTHARIEWDSVARIDVDTLERIVTTSRDDDPDDDPDDTPRRMPDPTHTRPATDPWLPDNGDGIEIDTIPRAHHDVTGLVTLVIRSSDPHLLDAVARTLSPARARTIADQLNQAAYTAEHG